MSRALLAGLAGMTLAACATSLVNGTPDVSLADGGVAVAVGRGFEVMRSARPHASVGSVTLRRPSRVRGSFEECTVRAVPAPAGAAAAGLAAETATRRHETLARSGGLTNVTIDASGEPAVVTSDFTIERTLRTRERFWSLSRSGRVWLVQQQCQTVGSGEDLMMLEAATAPAFLPNPA